MLTKRFPFLRTRRGIAIVVVMVLLVIGAGLAGLAALHRGGGGGGAAAASTGNNSDGVITSDTWFYGMSPPVYPSPNITGVGDWADAFNKAVAMVKNMTLAEKVNLTAGVSASTSCSGNIPAVPNVGFPGLCLSDAGNGLRGTDFVSSWPSGIHVGASWNRNLTLQRALGMGAEFKKKGVNVLLGPVVGPLGRAVTSGRNWEGISVDPYLSGALVHETVTGIQKAGVITSTKHYIGNEQETNRQPFSDIQSVSSNIDDRTIHELYLWPFQDAVHAGSGNIMCSYNRLNNSYGCANSKSLNGLLKTELGFQGFVVSDWSAQHAGVATALAGLDMAMPGAGEFWGQHLIDAVKNGSVPESRIDDMATRIIAAWYQMGQDEDFPKPGVGMPSDLSKPHKIVDGRDPASKGILMDGAVEGHVLVKNIRNALPLAKPKMLSIFGYSARAPDKNNYAAGPITAWGFGAQSANLSDLVSGFLGGPHSDLGIAPNGTIFAGGGSGATSQSLVSAPFDAINQQAWDDGTELFWDFTSAAPTVVPVSDACLVIGNAWATEGYDRPNVRDDYTDGLVRSVAGNCNNTIVVLHNAGARLVDQFVDLANVTAVIFAHLPGQASGRALVDLLYGRAVFSGKLPYTVARNESDYAQLLSPSLPAGNFQNFPQSNFTEGAFLDYRHFDAANVTPRYEFGFGLSYTTFNYSDLAVELAQGANHAELPTGAVRPGGQADLWDLLATVTAKVTNTGKIDGAEVAQLYLSLPSSSAPAGTPIRQLRGFDKPLIPAGASATVSFPLTRRDLSYWDVVAQKWRMLKGTYTVSVGGSSRNLPLKGDLVI